MDRWGEWGGGLTQNSDSPEFKNGLPLFGLDFQGLRLLDLGLGTWAQACQFCQALINIHSYSYYVDQIWKLQIFIYLHI